MTQPLYLVGKRDADVLSLPPASRRSALPAYPDALVGRAAELDALDAMLLRDRKRLVTILGPGGMGKTRLVTAWSERTSRTNDVAYTPLAALASGEHFATALAVVLGLTISPEADSAEQVLRALRDREVILVLDNLEHLLEEGIVTAFVRGLLERCPAVRIVATSRERLGLAGENVLELAGLGVADDAIELFVERARQIRSTFDHEKERASVVEICRVLEGIPLGLELAATWVRVLQCDEILAEMKRALDFLTADARSGRDARQSSMRAVFEYSWKLLSDDEKRVLANLSVFRGGFDRAAAEHVAGASLAVLAALVDRSLVRARRAGKTTRYDMHELLRQYAAEQLGAAGEKVALAHAEWFATRAQEIHPSLRGEGQVDALAELGSDLDNLRAALEFANAHARWDLGARIGWALWPFWWIRNMQREGYRFMERVLAHGDALDLFWRSQATIASGAMLYALGDVETTLRSARELERLAKERGNDPRPLAFAYGAYGLGATAKGDPKGAIENLAKSRKLFLEAGDPGIAAQAAVWIGTVQLLVGNHERARESATQALDESLASGDRVSSTSARYCLARIAIAAGAIEEGIEHLLASIPPSIAIDDRGSLSYVFELLGVACAERDPEAAAKLFGASDAILRSIGSRGHTYYMPDKKGIERARTAARDALGAEAFDAAHAGGGTSSIDALVAIVKAKRSLPAAGPAAEPAPNKHKVRYFEEDDSVFVDNEYLIKGIAGRLLWRMLDLHLGEGRSEFTNRELRLDPTLKLPSYKDNLEARLILLVKRLEEKTWPIRLEKTGRGKLRLVLEGAIELAVTRPDTR